MKTAYLGLEAKRALRNPRFLMFTMVFPVVIFVIDVGAFGKGDVPGSTASYAAYLMVSMSAFGAFMAAMNTGARTAVERAAGWQRQLRLTPLKPMGYLVAKGAVGTLVALPPILLVALVGVLLEHVHLSAAGWVQVVLGVWVATIPFAVLGLLVGQLATSETMQVFTSGLMIVLGFLGGVLIPVQVFPNWIANIAKVLPSYWLADVGHGALLGNTDIGKAALWLAGWTVVFAFAVVRRYQRDSARV
ncbi:MAG TPA: ABC transporter permease [Pseudonocardiaceae bacterium]|jgi:ABC-2 type transport system permease protein|nr:ABC transporter permease [Pseudonocardiaceae bacterium]